jgi:hypothetical protein
MTEASRGDGYRSYRQFLPGQKARWTEVASKPVLYSRDLCSHIMKAPRHSTDDDQTFVTFQAARYRMSDPHGLEIPAVGSLVLAHLLIALRGLEALSAQLGRGR